jgi:hypothetical protein
MKDKKPKGSKLRTTRTLTRDEEGIIYNESRGIRSLSIGSDGKDSGRDPAATGQLMGKVARDLLKRLGARSIEDVVGEAIKKRGNDQKSAVNKALLDWYSKIAEKHGILSVPALAAKFLGISQSLTSSTADALLKSDIVEDDEHDAAMAAVLKHMTQVFALCDAWHWLHMEFFGEHELAFAKQNHAAGQLKGSQSTAEKAAKRAAIVRAEITALRERTKDASKLTPAFVTRQIRDVANVLFVADGLKACKTDEAFEQLVRRIMAAN